MNTKHEEIIGKRYKKACDRMEKVVKKQRTDEAPFAFDARDAVIEALTTSRPMVEYAAKVYVEAEKRMGHPGKHFKVATGKSISATQHAINRAAKEMGMQMPKDEE